MLKNVLVANGRRFLAEVRQREGRVGRRPWSQGTAHARPRLDARWLGRFIVESPAITINEAALGAAAVLRRY